MKNRSFEKEVMKIAIPVALQSMLQSSFSMVDQIMVGQLGEKSIAGIEIAGKPSFIYSFVLGAIAVIAGIMVSQYIGKEDSNKAYKESIWLCIYGFAGSLCLSVLLVFLRFPYVHIYQVEATVHGIGAMLLLAFAILTPVKVLNMILGGGVIRSGGKTKYIMMIDMLGTWLIGVPLALYTGLVLKFPIVWVYFILSQEELVRLIISVFMFKSRKWMNTID